MSRDFFIAVSSSFSVKNDHFRILDRNSGPENGQKIILAEKTVCCRKVLPSFSGQKWPEFSGEIYEW